MPITVVRLVATYPVPLVILMSLMVASGCGEDDEVPSDAAPGPAADARPLGPADAAVGVVCSGAEANYPGSLDNAAASDDGATLEFRGALGASDVLRIRIASDTATTGSVDLPDTTWSVEICIDDGDETCVNALKAYSGTLTVNSVEGRFRASLDRIIFVDDLNEPTCSAALSQSSMDVSILGPV